jgi:hypothetical protein
MPFWTRNENGCLTSTRKKKEVNRDEGDEGDKKKKNPQIRKSGDEEVLFFIP